MAKINPYENSAMKAMLENMRVATNLFASNPALESAVRQANIFATSTAIQSAMGITSQFNDVFLGNEKMMKSFLDAFSFQTEILRSTQQFYLTETINTFRSSLMHNNYFSAIEAITKSLQSAIIEVPNIALLRLNKPLLNLIDVDLPRGLRTSIATLHTKTAIDLSTSENISYNSKDATFFVEANPDDNCKAKEVNVIFSAARLFSDLTEEELFALHRHLSTYPSLGPAHYVGEKIMKLVKNIETTISFDSEYFYHARTIDDDASPYTDEDMTCAPHGITSFGRFNHIGDNYFYFSDQKNGAVEEVRKHSPKNKVQVAKLRPKGKIRMVDISKNEENVFLKYCRFKFDPTSNKKVPREYLIPSYFSDCCKLQGFDGIKYHGTQSYKNYVTWKDGHFVFVDQEIIDMVNVGN
ncbi:MAG: RES domain-containing protein [Firmicutes bacterium]|nr:RES domain-containing protein [Bacillota bacterium]